MGLFSKKVEVPQLPPVTQVPEPPRYTQEVPPLPTLPSFPPYQSESQANFSGEREVMTSDNLPQIPIKQIEPVQSIQPVQQMQPNQTIKRDSDNTIFVRMDKFEEARRDFDEIKRKVKEIEQVLGKVKEMKSKEDNEISDWTSGLEKIKSKISGIDENFFNKI